MARSRGQGGRVTRAGKGIAAFWSGRFYADIRHANGRVTRKKITERVGYCRDLTQDQARLKLLDIIAAKEAKFASSTHGIVVAKTDTSGRLESLARQMRGRVGEMLVAIDLMSHGLEVFEHVNEFASFDLIAMVPGSSRAIRIEVKYIGRAMGKSGWNNLRLKPHDIAKFDILAAVYPDGSIAYMDQAGQVVPNFNGKLAGDKELRSV